MRDLARAVGETAAESADQDRLKREVTTAGKARAIVEFAQADRAHAALIEQWDADPWLLATPGGTIDLRTGAMRAPDPLDYITCCTGITPSDTGIECWLSCLDRWFDGDADLIGYIRRVLGYSLSGMTNEHQFWFLHGPGRNGKGVFLHTIMSILGNYATATPAETFMASAVDRHPTDLAALRGSRLVTATETEGGARWAESRLKALTGGDKIAARFMRQDFFTYDPAFKILISGNHRPSIRTIDEAMKARVRLVPFSVTIPKAERDPHLEMKLRAEHPGILHWMVAATLEYLQRGLDEPAVIEAATAQYFADEDVMARWIEAECRVHVSERAAVAPLYGSFLEWCKINGEHAVQMKAFVQGMEARGFPRHKGAQGVRELRGVALYSSYQPDRGTGGTSGT